MRIVETRIRVPPDACLYVALSCIRQAFGSSLPCCVDDALGASARFSVKPVVVYVSTAPIGHEYVFASPLSLTSPSDPPSNSAEEHSLLTLSSRLQR